MTSGNPICVTQELDKHWSIRYETVIRAKSNKGFKTRVWKVTQNKFQLEVERPELVDDWDQRLLMSTLSWNVKANRLTMVQIAEKDQVMINFISFSCYHQTYYTAVLPGQHHHI